MSLGRASFYNSKRRFVAACASTATASVASSSVLPQQQHHHRRASYYNSEHIIVAVKHCCFTFYYRIGRLTTVRCFSIYCKIPTLLFGSAFLLFYNCCPWNLRPASTAPFSTKSATVSLVQHPHLPFTATQQHDHSSAMSWRCNDNTHNLFARCMLLPSNYANNCTLLLHAKFIVKYCV